MSSSRRRRAARFLARCPLALLGVLGGAAIATAAPRELVRCPGGSAGAVTLDSGSWLLPRDCVIEGDLTLRTNASLIVVFAALTVRGDVDISDDSQLLIVYSTLRMDNEFSGHRKIRAAGRSLLYLGHSLVETNIRDDNNHFSAYEGRDSSALVVDGSILDTRNSWIAARLLDRASMRANASENLPKELFLQNSSTAIIQGMHQQAGMAVWVSFPGGASADVWLPDQTGPYDWSFGRDSPGVTGIDFRLRIVDSWPSLGVVSLPGSSITLRGRGEPDTGELTIAYHVSGGTSVLENLAVGRQSIVLDDGRLELVDVHLGRTAWQIYCYFNDLLTLRNSVVNEVAAFTEGKVRVEASTLQLALLAGAGDNSSISVFDSDIWTQSILTNGTGSAYIENSEIHGSVLQANDESTLHIVGGQLLPNGDGAPCSVANALGEDGQPRCNPFLPNGAVPVQRVTGNGEIIIEP